MSTETKTLNRVARSLYKENKKRNVLIIFSTAMIITLLFSIASIFWGRINMEYLMGIREKGSTANVSLTQPTEQQFEDIKQLSYIEYVGKESNIDHITDEDAQDIIHLVSTDETTFNKVFLPAFSNYVGELPENTSEILMSKKALALLGIHQPHVGDELTMSLKNNGTVKFILSGYYDDYVAKSIDLPKAFISAGSLEKNIFKENAELSRLLMIQKRLDSSHQIEKQLYEDIHMVNETQQFIVENARNFEAISKSIGGYSIGIGMILLILVCSFLFIHNIFYISYQKDINRLGTLKSIGATKKQLKKIQEKQLSSMLFWGACWGILIGLLINLALIPQLLDRIHVMNYGKANTIIAFNPLLLFICVIVSLLFVRFSSKTIHFKLRKMDTKSAMAFSNTNKSIKVRRFRLFRYGKNNVMRNKKQLVFTSLSLVLGFSSILVSSFIVKGLDMTHAIDKENSDFKIIAGLPPMIQSDGMIADRRTHQPISSEIVNDIQTLNGVEKVQITFATYAIVDDKTPALEPLVKMNHRGHEYSSNELANDFMASITIADEDYIEKLEGFLERNELSEEFNAEQFKNGESVFLLHKNEFSPDMSENARKLIGEEIAFQNLDRQEVGHIEFGGYLNRGLKSFPEINSTFVASGEPYFIISEKGFAKLQLEKEIWQLRIESDTAFDVDINEELTAMIDNRNLTLADFEQIVLIAKADIKAAAKNYIDTIRIISNTLGIILTIFGVFNYINVFISNFFSRIQEFETLRQIGMTKKQLNKMLLFEGLIVSTIISIGLMIMSNAMISVVGNYLTESVDYFNYSFPFTLMLLMIAFCYTICLVLPRISLKYLKNIH